MPSLCTFLLYCDIWVVMVCFVFFFFRTLFYTIP